MNLMVGMIKVATLARTLTAIMEADKEKDFHRSRATMILDCDLFNTLVIVDLFALPMFNHAFFCRQHVML